MSMMALALICTIIGLFVYNPLRSTTKANDHCSASIGQQLESYKSEIGYTWHTPENVVFVADVLTLNDPNKVSTDLPFARLRVRNLDTNQIIFEENNIDSPVSICVRPLNESIGEALIVNWSSGSTERIEIFQIEKNSAEKVLDEPYRIDAAFMDLSGTGNFDVFITTSERGTGPFTTTRYSWIGDRYKAVGKALYKVFGNAIGKQFRPKYSS